MVELSSQAKSIVRRSIQLWPIAIVVLLGCPASAAENSPSFMIGTWRLVEWAHEGEILIPPLVEGRISIHNGVSMFIAHRQTENGRVSIFGYGSYSIAGMSYSYGYDRLTEVRVSDGETSVWTEPIPTAELMGTLEEARFVLRDAETGDWGFVIEGDTMLYFENDQTLRKYVRVTEQRKAPGHDA